MAEYVYRIVDEEGEEYAGYNNASGFYLTPGGARQYITRALKTARRHGWPERELRVQRAPIVWEDM